MTSQHAWDMSSSLGRMKIEEETVSLDLPLTLDSSTAERYIEDLNRYQVEDVGTSAWMEQHARIEQLNIQAHQCALMNHDEFVVEGILTFRKLDSLIFDLLVIEAWKDFVFPLLKEQLAKNNSMRCYFILYHETTLMNLFEVLFFHKHVCEAAGEKLIEFVDYLARKLTKLNGGHDFRSLEPRESSAAGQASALENRSPLEEMEYHYTDIEFKVCIAACSILRFFCEHSDSLPLSVSSRIADTHDFLMLVIPLIENPPWTRRINGKWQKLVDHKWVDVAPIDLLKVTKLEGQPWLSLYYLIAKKCFRERYSLTSFRKSQLLRVRKYLNEVLLDQLPFLADIQVSDCSTHSTTIFLTFSSQRYMDELSIAEAPPSSSGASAFLFEQVAVERERILKGKEWSKIADHQMKHTFTMTDRDDNDLRRLVDLYVDDKLTEIIEPTAKS